MLKKKITIIIIVGLAVGWGMGAAAQADIAPKLKISPPTVEASVFIGETIERSVEITNQSDVALPIKVKVVDFRASDESGGMEFDPIDLNPSVSAKSWFEIEKPDFILDPQEKQTARFKIKIPVQAENRGYYAAILFEPQLPSFYFKENQPRAIPVMGVLNFITVESLSLDEEEVKNKLEVVGLSTPPQDRIVFLENSLGFISGNFKKLTALMIGEAKAASPVEVEILKKPPSSFLLRLKNNDSYHLKVGGKLVVLNWLGQKVGEANIATKTILPGTIRQFPAEFKLPVPGFLKWLPESWSRVLTDNLFLGKYEAKLDLKMISPVALEEMIPVLPWSFGFWALPWQFWIMAAAILAFIFLIIKKHRGRFALAWQALLKNTPQEDKTAVVEK